MCSADDHHAAIRVADSSSTPVLRRSTARSSPEVDGPHQDTNDRIRTVTGRTFEEQVLHSEDPLVVEFKSYGCAHCRTLEPVLQEVVAMLSPRVTVVRVNIAIEQERATSYDVEATPTLIMFRRGREVGRVEGPPPTLSTLLDAVTKPFERSDGFLG